MNWTPSCDKAQCLDHMGRRTLSLISWIAEFSYLYGLTRATKRQPRDFADKVRTAGYSFACTGVVGVARNDSDRFLLNRIPVYGQDSLLDFEVKVSGSYDWVGKVKRIDSHIPTYFRG
jgi:hypothetical protein